jgi:hypothetical protein
VLVDNISMFGVLELARVGVQTEEGLHRCGSSRYDMEKTGMRKITGPQKHTLHNYLPIFVLTSTLETKASTTFSQFFAFMTSNMVHCHVGPIPVNAAVAARPSPAGKPMIHCEEYRNTSPTFSTCNSQKFHDGEWLYLK